jgi:hypothetical protein
MEDADVVMAYATYAAYATCFLTEDGESLVKLCHVCGLGSVPVSGVRDALVLRVIKWFS